MPAARAEVCRLLRSRPCGLWEPDRSLIPDLLSHLRRDQQQETVEALRAAGYERAAVIGELLGLEEEGAAGEGGQSLIELVVSPKA